MPEWKLSDKPTPMLVRYADALAKVCDEATRSSSKNTPMINPRSPIGDALLDYQQERDRMAAEAARTKRRERA